MYAVSVVGSVYLDVLISQLLLYNTDALHVLKGFLNKSKHYLFIFFFLHCFYSEKNVGLTHMFDRGYMLWSLSSRPESRSFSTATHMDTLY